MSKNNIYYNHYYYYSIFYLIIITISYFCGANGCVNLWDCVISYCLKNKSDGTESKFYNNHYYNII